jgi:hypothetical protein
MNLDPPAMNLDPPALDAVRRVADAVLYEGYILYPYRASAQKNRSRWQFGVLMPPGYTAVDPSESARLRAECVFEQSGEVELEVAVIVRFLQVQRRNRLGPARDPAVPASWDEAVEHEVPVSVNGHVLFADPHVAEFVIPGGEEHGDGIVRTRTRLTGTVSVRAEPLPGPWQAARLTVEVTNGSMVDATPVNREQALPGALVAAHLIIGVSGGAFVSMTDPPEWAKPAVDNCRNTGCWPVLAGLAPSRQMMLAAPIILPEYPEVAPESAGELYDGTEIDEILTLRTLALSDEEKREARATDPRAAALLDRVEAMDGPTLGRLHGTFRTPATTATPDVPWAATSDVPWAATPDVPWWDPAADASVSPDTDTVTVAGRRLSRGSRVTLRPGIRRADAQDMFLAGRAAIVEAVLLDVDDNPYLAVSLADAPDPELSAAHGRFMYFAPDEVEPNEPKPYEPKPEEPEP